MSQPDMPSGATPRGLPFPPTLREMMAAQSSEALARWVLKNLDWTGGNSDENGEFLAAIFSQSWDQAKKSAESEIETPTETPAGPLDDTVKRPRLFYWEDAEDCWAPADGLEVDNIINADSIFADGDIEEIRFKRMDMTDAEFAAIPEG